MEHTISVLVENRFGVLARIAGLFSARGYNISSLSVSTTLDPLLSRMTIVVQGDDKILEQIVKQLRKLIDVVKVQDFVNVEYVDIELVLIKIECPANKRPEIIAIADVFNAKVLHLGIKTAVLECTGDKKTIGNFIEILTPYGIKEIARSGSVALSK